MCSKYELKPPTLRFFEVHIVCIKVDQEQFLVGVQVLVGVLHLCKAAQLFQNCSYEYCSRFAKECL